MSPKKRLGALLSISALSIAALTACAPSNDASDGNSLMVYYGTPRDIMKPLFDGFIEEHPDIKVEQFRQPTEELMSTLQLEIKGGNTRADVIISSAAQLEALDTATSALVPYDSKEAALIEPSLIPENKHINPLGMNLYVIAYNSDMIDKADAPQSFADLLDPKWKDKIAMADPNASGSIHSFIYHMTNVLSEQGAPYGWDFFSELSKLSPRLEASHGTVRDLVLSGERPVGLILTEQLRVLAGDPAGAWSWPTESLPAEPLGMGIVKSAEDNPAAKAFVDFVQSDKGQKIVSEVMGLVPVRTDLDFEFADGTTLDEIDIVGVDSAFIAKSLQEQSSELHKRLGGR